MIMIMMMMMMMMMIVIMLIIPNTKTNFLPRREGKIFIISFLYANTVIDATRNSVYPSNIATISQDRHIPVLSHFRVIV